jgi:hypothetical protein
VVYRSMLLVIGTVAQLSGPYRYQHTGRITVRMMGTKGRIQVKRCTLLSRNTSPEPAIQPPARLWRIAMRHIHRIASRNPQVCQTVAPSKRAHASVRTRRGIHGCSDSLTAAAAYDCP